MKYVILSIFWLYALYGYAQSDSTMKVDFKLVEWSDSDLENMLAKGKKRRSKWEAYSLNGSSIKIISKPVRNITKVKVKGITELYTYELKYFVIGGDLSSYELKARSSADGNVVIFGAACKMLQIDLQKIDGGYIGKTRLKSKQDLVIYNRSFILLYNEVKKIRMISDELLVLLPEITEQ